MENECLHPDELQHWGIKGMKWGIRRFQNKDGSLTDAGRKRYDDDPSNDDTSNKPASSPKKAPNEMTGKDYKQMKPSDMTDEELRRAIERSRMEKAYAELNPVPVSRGKEIVDKIVFDKLIPSAIDAGKNFLDKKLGKIIDEAMKDAKPESEYDKLKKKYDIEKLKKDIKGLEDGGSEYDKLKKDYDIAKLKKDLDDLGKPKEESLSDQKRRRQDEIELEKLNDSEYQAKKKASEMADMQNKINKAKKGEVYDTDDDGNVKTDDSKPKNNTSENKNKQNKTKSEAASGEVTGEGKSKSSIKEDMDSGKDWWKSYSDTSTYKWSDSSVYSDAHIDAKELGKQYTGFMPDYFQLPIPEDD